MICNILSVINKYSMLENTKSVAVGVSGGADSVCLLHFLTSIRDEYGIIIKAVHVNHNIRGEEALRDEAYVRSLCEKLCVELTVFDKDIPSLAKQMGMSEEECGRYVRYKCFKSMNCDKIAVAHTLSDSVETMLFNLCRGSSLKGVCGIPPVRDDIIRPLIELTREQIESYCKENLLTYVTDSTNLKDIYTRNSIRLNVVPNLERINPSFEKAFLRFFESAREDNSCLETLADDLILKSKLSDGYAINILSSADDAILKRAVAKIIKPCLNKDIENKHILLCLKIIREKKGAVELSKNLHICADSDKIFFHRYEYEEKASLAFCVKAKIGENKTPGGTFVLRICHIEDSTLPKYMLIDAKFAGENLLFRSRQSGDTLKDRRRSNTKTLKKLFTELKIPKEKRNEIAVLSNESGKVLWVDGICADAHCAVSHNTEMVIEIIKKDA